MQNRYRHWTVAVIAGVYLVLCLGCLGYLIDHVGQAGFRLPWAEGMFVGMGVVFGAVYFVVPKWGYWGLVLLTGLVILHIGERDGRGTVFHLGVLGVLMLAFYRGRRVVG